MRTTRAIAIVLLFAIMLSNICFSDDTVYWDVFIYYEDMLKQSDCIVVATVEDTYVERKINNYSDMLERCTVLKVNELIKGDGVKQNDSIVLKTDQGKYLNSQLQELFYIPAEFNKNDEVLLYLRNINDEYRLFYETYGKFDICNGMIEHCNIPKDKFIAEIEKVLVGEKEKFELVYPDYYINSKTSIEKTTQIEDEDYISLPCDEFQFRAIDIYPDEQLPVNITFYINPEGGYALPDSTYIGFATLRTIAQNACNLWNAVDGGAINFSVAADSVSNVENDDECSVICFSPQSGTATAHATPQGYENNTHEWDIVFGEHSWSLYSGYSLTWTMIHEMGHVAGLEDLGTDMGVAGDDTSYCHNIMWHSGYGFDPSIVSPQLGDKQGIVYHATDLSDGFPTHDIILGDRSFPDGLTIPAGRLAVVRHHEDLLIGPAKSINIYGAMQIESGSKIDKLSDYHDEWNNLNVCASGTVITASNSRIDDFSHIQIDGTATFHDIDMAGAGSTVTIASNQSMGVAGTLQLGPGTQLNINGYLTLDSGALITKIPGEDEWDQMFINNGAEMCVAGSATIEYSDNWTVNVYNGGILDIDDVLTIQNSLCGITLETGSELQKDTDTCLHIDNCVTGLRVYENTELIENVEFEDCTRAMYIQGSSSNPQLKYITVDDQETYGMIVSTNSSASLNRSIIGSGTTSTWPYNIWLYSGAYINMVAGMNDIYPRAGGYAIYMDPNADYVQSTMNYWGSSNPLFPIIFNYPNKVIHYYDSSFPYGNGAYKATVTEENIVALLMRATELEHNNEWIKADTIYKDILSITDNTIYRRIALMALLRVIDHSTKDYTGFREMIWEELKTCSDIQRCVYDNLLCELNVREGLYQEAINAYEQLLPKYDGSEVGVEILARLAKLYNDNFNDQITAKTYADRAASINPGQLSLEIAYEAVGVKYDPFEYTDIFRTLSDSSDEKPKEPRDETVEFITNSPNPFNPDTTFNFAISDPGTVKLVVYSITSQKIATLVDDWMDAGTHSVRFEGRDLASGMYIYQFSSPGFSDTGRMLLVK